MESSESLKRGEDQRTSDDSLLKDQSTKSCQSKDVSQTVQSQYIKFLEDITVLVGEDDQIDDEDSKNALKEQRINNNILNGDSKLNDDFLKDDRSEIKINVIDDENDEKALVLQRNLASLEEQFMNGDLMDRENLDKYMSKCEKLIVQSMPNMTNSNHLKVHNQTNFGLSILDSRSPSHNDVSEIEKQFYSKIHARSRIAKHIRKKNRYENRRESSNSKQFKEFTLPSGFKVAYSSQNAQNRSYKFNKNKHHYQPPVQFQRSLSCSVAVLNSLSLPSKKYSKRRRDSSESSSTKKPLLGSHKRPKLNLNQILTLICLASLAFVGQCSMSIIAPFFPLNG